MAVLEEGVYARLSGSTGVTSIVSTRIYPEELPQNPTYPALTYQRISGNSHFHQTGLTGLGEGRIQVTCWAQKAEKGGGDYPQVKDLREAVRLALAGFQGTAGGVDIRSVDFTNDLDIQTEDNDRLGLKQNVLDFVIRHVEATS